METCTIEEILKKVRSGDTLAFAYMHSGLDHVLKAFTSADLPENVKIFMLFLRFRQDDLLALGDFCNRSKAHLITPLPIPEYSKLIRERKLDVLYVPYSKIEGYLASRVGRVWLFCEIAPPDEDSCNTGYVSAFPLKLHRRCTTVGIINQAMPKTYGDSKIPRDSFDYFVDAPEGKLPLYMETKESEAGKRIGKYVSELIEDGSTLQLGIGSVIPPLIEYISEKENLKIHTGLLNQNFRQMIEKGVIAGKCYTHVATPYTNDFYDWLNLNPNIEMKAIDYIYNVSVISAIPKFMAVNTAVYIDLQGQAVATSIGSRVISGIGGLLDFCRGAKLSKGGKSILTMEATYKDGTETRIKPAVMEGDLVSPTCYDIDYVVTEYGVACIDGKSRGEIASNLIEIAAPDHRKFLREEAKKLS